MLDKEVKPYRNSPLAKKEQIEHMFDRISSRYDLLNRILSFGIDLRWRRKVVRLLNRFHPSELLDIATGTGDMAIMIAKGLPTARVMCLDVSEGMLEIARQKILNKGFEQRINLMQGDAESAPFKEECFDAVTVAFGVRNFGQLNQGLKEIHRVLKPGGVMLILEFSQPKNSFVKYLYRIYSHYIAFVGHTISKDPVAYDYLPRSVVAFPYGTQMERILMTCGFVGCYTIPITFGIASIYVAEKSNNSQY